MQMHVNFFDRQQRVKDETPTIGIVRCSDNNDAMVRITVPKDNEQLHANRCREAGASNMMRYRFSTRDRDPDAFFCSNFMTACSEGARIDGHSPLGFPPDLMVFVA